MAFFSPTLQLWRNKVAVDFPCFLLRGFFFVFRNCTLCRRSGPSVHVGERRRQLRPAPPISPQLPLPGSLPFLGRRTGERARSRFFSVDSVFYSTPPPPPISPGMKAEVLCQATTLPNSGTRDAETLISRPLATRKQTSLNCQISISWSVLATENRILLLFVFCESQRNNQFTRPSTHPPTPYGGWFSRQTCETSQAPSHSPPGRRVRTPPPPPSPT